MKRSFQFQAYLPDLLFIFGAGIFFFSCVASTLHTAKTLQPGQGSVSAGYLQARDMEELSSDPLHLMGFNGRVGVFRGFDLGTEYTLDLTKGNENSLGTIWVDGKIQLTNRSNQLLKPTLATGLMKGYVHKAETHATSLPLLLSLPVNDKLTCTLTYRYELFSESIIPTDSEVLHTFAAGLEFGLLHPDHTKWIPKAALSLGMFNAGSLSSEWDPCLLFSFGFKIESPYKIR